MAAAWDERGLEACLDLNLPCFNATGLLPTPLERQGGEVHYRTADMSVVV